MKITSSYGMKLTGDSKALENTISIYRNSLCFIIPIVDAHWDEVKDFEYSNQRMMYVEKLIHSTIKSDACYNFDEEFPKFPSYLRRAVLNDALGIVSSYHSNLTNWKKESKGQAPQLGLTHYAYPAYYKKNLFRNFDPVRQTIELKVFKNGDWVFETYKLKTSDCSYYQNHLIGKKQNVPVIQKKGRRFYATFSYEENVPLVPEESINKICAVDLGLGTDATCSIMDQDGTVYARKFISFSEEHDRLNTQLGRIKRNQKRGSRHRCRLHECKNLQKQQRIVNKLYERISRIRTDYNRKSLKSILKRKPSFIVIEDLNVKGLMKNKHLSKAISQAQWYMSRVFLQQQCEKLGIELRLAPRFYPSSKLCSNCGYKNVNLKLKDRSWECPDCHVVHNRDENAAINLEKCVDYTVLTTV